MERSRNHQQHRGTGQRDCPQLALGRLCRKLDFCRWVLTRTYRGQAVDSTTILIAYTRTADANLDGLVNNDDVTIVGANFSRDAAKPAWAIGDFEYNASVDADDVTLLGVFYNPGVNPTPAPGHLPKDGPSVTTRRHSLRRVVK